jgi:glutaredoxin
MTEDNPESKQFTFTVKRPSLWMISTVALIIIVLVMATWPEKFGLTGRFASDGIAGSLTTEDAKKKAIDYINENLVQPGTNASVASIQIVNGVFKIMTSYQGREIPIYMTLDGTYLFLQSVDITQPVPTTTTTQPQQFSPPKTDKPTVELFVMSFCPFGMQAENIMKPVVDLLGAKTDIKIRFIASVQGTTVDSVNSLHGPTEAQEDMRQLCVMKNYDQQTYWNYLMGIDNNCSGKIDTRDQSALSTCWKSVATNVSVDVAKIESCVNTEGVNLIKADEQLAEQYGVTGSPTLIINGQAYSGTRTSEAFKQAICSAFTTQPTECSQALTSSTQAPSGGCG